MVWYSNKSKIKNKKKNRDSNNWTFGSEIQRTSDEIYHKKKKFMKRCTETILR